MRPPDRVTGVKKSKPAVIDILCDFDSLNRAIIDTSTLIYLHKIGALECVSRSICLMTISQVIDEFGDKSGLKYIKIIKGKDSIDGKKSADEMVVKIAAQMHLPVLSEDKGLLTNARKNGLKYYNTLMILNFLLYRRNIADNDYTSYLQKLKKVAHYGQNIYAFGKILYDAISIKKYPPDNPAGE